MAESNLTKQCSVCHWFLPIENFYTSVRKRRNNQPYTEARCKDCAKLYAKTYYKKNRERALRTVNAYRARNKDKIAATNRRYQRENHTRIRKHKREYERRVRQTPDFIVKRSAFMESHRHQLNANSQRWRERNPERRRASVKANKMRRANATGRCSAEQWIAKVDYFGWRCYLCGTPVTSKTLHMDHRKPLARGGSHWPANLAPACGPCNLRKNNKTEAEFRIKKHLILGEKSAP